MVAFIRKKGKAPTAAERTDIAAKRAALQIELDRFHEMAGNLFPALDAYDINFEQIPYGDDVIFDAEDNDPEIVPSIPRGNVEKLEVLLPSTFPDPLPVELRPVRVTELKLRTAQADEALEGIRREICHKSYIYRTNVRLIANKKSKLRGYAALHVADRALRQHIRIYKQARWSLQRLGASEVDLNRFRELTDNNMQPLKSIYLPNARGQSTVAVPWIWKVHVAEGAESEYLGECELPCLFTEHSP